MEFALVLPLVLVVMLALAQVVVVTYAQLGVTHAAREAARMLAVDPGLSHAELERHVGYQLEVTMGPASPAGQQFVHVVARHAVRPISPIFGPVLDQVQVRAEARISLE